MTKPSGNDASYDPRDWLKQSSEDSGNSREARDGAIAGNGTFASGAEHPDLDAASFDPKTWMIPDSAKTQAAAISGGDTPAATGARRMPRAWLITALIAAIIVTALAALFLRQGLGASGLSSRAAPATPPGALAADARRDVAPGISVRSLKLASSGEIAPTLRQAGIDASLAAQVAARVGSAIAPNTEIDFEFGLDFSKPDTPLRLAFAQGTVADGSGMRVTPGPDGLSGQTVKASLERRVRTVRGELDTESFYTSAVSAGVDDSLISDFVNAFAFDFNLAHEVRPGDVFEVAMTEQVNARGERVGKPELLYVSLTTAEKSKDLYRFKPDGEKQYGWFDANGTSTVRAFMRTPIDGARISSKFGIRFHPVLKYNRLHGGTDFAAPVGTPIYAAADATVRLASPSRCAGNMVILTHGKGYETRYFHLSRYADGLHSGQTVRQGETIGYVGNTGTCTTGPHLHYEVHIAGQKIDPLTVDTGEARTLSRALRDKFYAVRDAIDRERAAAGS